jgi:hypothetical protein
VDKQKTHPGYARRLWSAWQRKSLWIYAAGVLYLLVNLAVYYIPIAIMRLRDTAGSHRGYILLSTDEANLLILLTLVVGIVMLAAVIGYGTYSSRWIEAIAMVAAGFQLWSFTLTSVLSYAFMPRVAIVAHGEHVYQLASSIFSTRYGCSDETGICDADEYQFFECNRLALMCLQKGDVFIATMPRLEIVDGVVRVVRYNEDGDFVDVVYEVPR